jgi:hypothetical protein
LKIRCKSSPAAAACELLFVKFAKPGKLAGKRLLSLRLLGKEMDRKG